MMQLTNVVRATAFAGLVACGGGGSGTVDVSDDPGGPFSGFGNPGRSSYDNPGIFVGSGAPGVGGSTDITSLLVGFCDRVHATCPETTAAACVGTFQSQWVRLTSDCERALYYAFVNCLLTATVTCSSNGQAETRSCVAPSLSQCGGTTGTTGGGTGGTGTGGTGGNDTGGSGGTGGTGGTGTGGSGGNTGGSGGTGGMAGTGGTGGRGGRDGGRG